MVAVLAGKTVLEPDSKNLPIAMEILNDGWSESLARAVRLLDQVIETGQK